MDSLDNILWHTVWV